MKPFAIIADTNCDLSEELQQTYDIKIVPGHVVFPDKTEYPSYPRWDIVSREAFYADLKKHPQDYATSPPNVAEFRAACEPFVRDGIGVLLMTISGGISGAIGFAEQARRELLADYPGAELVCVDSRRFGPGFGLMTVLAARMREAGKTLAETAAWLEENKNRIHQAGWLDDLTFVARKGRITQSKAFFGTLVGVKPIGEFDYNGLTTVLGKVKGAKAAYPVLLDYMAATGEDLENQTVIIAQTCRMPQAEEFKRLIEERFHPKELMICDVHCSCGVNIGPGLMAAYYLGKPISEGLTEERALFKNLTEGNM